MSGWFKVDRDVFSNGVFDTGEPFTRREAWLWLLANAAWQDTRHTIGNTVYDVPIGSLFVTLRELQTAWRWQSDKRVRGYLKALENNGKIGRKKDAEMDAKKTHITICNYCDFENLGRNKNEIKTQKKRTKERIEEFKNEEMPYINVDNNHIGESIITRLQRVKSLNPYEKQLVDMGVSEGLLAEWNAVRSRKKAPPISETVIKSLTRESTIANYTIRKAIETCVERSWVGFKAEWVKPQSTKKTTSLYDAFETIINGDDQNDYGLN